MEKLLQHLQCSEEEKVRCVIFMLEKEAGRWWQSTKHSLQRSYQGHKDNDEDMIVLTWEKFKEIFDNKYFPRSWREEKF